MELSDNDKQRIHLESLKFDSYDKKLIWIDGAEYATLYERQQQTKPSPELKQLVERIWRRAYIDTIEDHVRLINEVVEAKRSELIKLLRDISWRFDCVAGSNMSDADKRLLKTIENSLKTK